jgi:hypothetical protein
MSSVLSSASQAIPGLKGRIEVAQKNWNVLKCSPKQQQLKTGMEQQL